MLCVSRAEVEDVSGTARAFPCRGFLECVAACPSGTACGMRSCRFLCARTRSSPAPFFRCAKFCAKRTRIWTARPLPSCAWPNCRTAAGRATSYGTRRTRFCCAAMRQLLSELSVSKPSRAHVDALMRLVSGTDGSQSITLPGGKILCRSYDKLAPDLRESPASFAPKKLSLDDETEIPELSLRVSCRFVKNFEKSMLSPCTFALRYDTIDAPKDLSHPSKKARRRDPPPRRT